MAFRPGAASLSFGVCLVSSVLSLALSLRPEASGRSPAARLLPAPARVQRLAGAVCVRAPAGFQGMYNDEIIPTTCGVFLQKKPPRSGQTVRPLLGLQSIFRQYIFPFLAFFVVSGKKILEKFFE